MDSLALLTALFPAIFMLHDFEEILLVEAWLQRNKGQLAARLPRVAKRLLPHFENLTTASFTVAVAEEFVLLLLATGAALGLADYRWWLAAFLAFSLHLIGHFGQCLLLGRYVPGVITAVLCIPYCVFTLRVFLRSHRLAPTELTGWALTGLVVMVLNLALAHFLGRQLPRLQRWLLGI